MRNQKAAGHGSRAAGAFRWLMLASVSAAALAAAPAFAQAAAPQAAPAAGPEEIVVTAQKRQENVNKVPMSITAVTARHLDNAGIKQPRDLGKLTPSFVYTDSSVGSPIYTLRGVGFSDISLGGRPTVSIYEDEAPIPFSIETRGASLDLERVEVLKGPQGTLFGQNATGGAINYIAAKPTRTFQAGAELSYGNYNALDLNGFVSGPVTDTLSARLTVEREQMDGWQKSYTTGKTNGSVDFTNGRATLAWTPTSRLRASLTLNGFIDHSEVQAGQVIAIQPDIPAAAAFVPGLLTYPLAPHNDTAADFNPGDDYHRHNGFFQANLRVDYDLAANLTVTSLTSYSHYNERQLQDIDGTTLSNINQITFGKIDSISQELRVSGSFLDRGHFVAGLNYAHDRVLQSDVDHIPDSTLAYLFTPFGLPLFTSFRDMDNQDSSTYAVFASGDYSLSDQFKIYGGARYTRAIDNFNGCTSDTGDGVAALDYGTLENVFRAGLGLGPNPPIPVGGCVTGDATFTPELVRSRLDESNVSWRAGGEWTPRPHLMIYANASKGYKAGSFPDLGATVATQLSPARQESVLAYEIGFKATVARTLQLNGAAFHYDYSDKQILGDVLDPFLGPLLKLVNIPKSEINGAELQLAWAPIRGLNVTAGGSYIDSRILDHFTNYDPRGVLTDFNGESFPNTPKWQLVADADYQWPVTDRLDAFVGGGVTYQSQTNSQLGDLPILSVNARALVDLRGGVQSADGTWRMEAWGRNVGNVYYWTAANRSIDTVVRFTGLPATYGVTLTYRMR
jgi:outer membrane receptor protein involved in Fe transport